MVVQGVAGAEDRTQTDRHQTAECTTETGCESDLLNWQTPLHILHSVHVHLEASEPALCTVGKRLVCGHYPWAPYRNEVTAARAPTSKDLAVLAVSAWGGGSAGVAQVAQDKHGDEHKAVQYLDRRLAGFGVTQMVIQAVV